MPQHYTKATTEALIFCKRCMNETLWRVADGRRQWCIPCYEKALARTALEKAERERAAKEEAARPQQMGLF